MKPMNVRALLFLTIAATALSAGAAVAAIGAAAPYEPIEGVSPVPDPEATGITSREDLEAFLDGVFMAHLKQNKLAGAVVSVVKDGEILLAKGYGYADVDKQVPADEHSLFRIGSTSKLLTWTAVMQMVEQGKVDLDADINEYLTQFKIPATFDDPVTLRNALTHTPGFEEGALGYLLVRTPEEVTPIAEALAAHIPTRVRPPTTDFSDGSNASYSNFATALAGLVVANVSGMSFDDYVDQNIFGPLDMQHSTFRQPLPGELAPQMATGYNFKTGAWEPYKYDYELIPFSPAGSVAASATDMAKFMIGHLNRGEYQGRRFLREETAKLMHSRQFSPHPNLAGSALGFYESYINGRRLLGHGGDLLTFHADLTLLPEENVGIFVAYNTSNGLGPSVARRDLVRGLMDRYYPATLPKLEAPSDFKERAARYAGTYRSNRHSFTTIEKLLAAAGGTKVIPTKDNTLLIGGGGQVAHWIEVAPNVFRQKDQDDMMAFVEGPNGEITGLVGLPFAFMASYKLAWYQAPNLHFFILGLGVLCFVVAIVSALRHWKSDRSVDAGARRARRLAAAVGATLLLFLALMAAGVAGGVNDLIFEFPTSVYVALALPLLAIPLTLGLLWFAVQGWKNGWWTRYGRIQYTVIVLASVAFLWTLDQHNLIGYHFG